MIEKIKSFLKRISTYFQTPKTSYKLHNQQYISEGKLEETKKRFEEYEKEDVFSHPQVKFGQLIEKNPGVRDLAVDIGAGAGWLSAKLSKYFRKVIAIEPSEAAIMLAKKLYPGSKYPNIKWINGFAEQILLKLNIESPALFFASTVLSHLRDSEVEKICKAIDKSAPIGSIFGFSECWGVEHHQHMWHVRTKEWWQKQFPGWKIDFHGPNIQNVPGRHKGFSAIKIK